jgi:hypothetical protein
MIVIIFGKPRAGKTALMTHYLTEAMFDREQYKYMKNEIKQKNNGGFRYSIPKKNVVCANYDIVGRRFGYRPRLSRRINPFRLGYANDKVRTHFIEPYSVIGITEGQKYFNSRMSLYYPDWQSRWFEQHGHNNYEIYIDVQRPKLIDINIRELATFVEIVHKQNIVKQSKIIGIIWNVKRYESAVDLELNKYTTETIIANYNVHLNYNSQMMKPRFFDGQIYGDFDTKPCTPICETIDGYIKYLAETDDELPQDFYGKRSLTYRSDSEDTTKRGVI